MRSPPPSRCTLTARMCATDSAVAWTMLSGLSSALEVYLAACQLVSIKAFLARI